MGIITLELNRPGTPEEGPPGTAELIQQLRMLIRGTALHAIESQAEDLTELQRGMAGIAGSLTTESSPDDLMSAVSRTLRLLAAYNRKADSLFKSQLAELREMLATMSETIQFVVSSSDTSVKQLTFMETQLQRATSLDDLRQLKTYTSACLSLVRRESIRLQTETRQRVDTLQKDVERLTVRLKTATVEESQDPVTGLPARAAAEQAIENRVSAGKVCLAALFLMDQLAAVNARFGHSVGDDVVMSCAQLLAKKLTGATLYRWSGTGFIAIFDPSVAVPEAEKRARQVGAQRLEMNVEAESRLLMIVVGFSCHLQQISSQTTPHELFRQMDGFMVAGQG